MMVTRRASGAPPMAAKSETTRAAAFQPTRWGSASGVKWMFSTTQSVLRRVWVS